MTNQISGKRKNKLADLLEKHGYAYPCCGAGCGDGWLKLIEQALIDLSHRVTIEQIKEKFGGLRFYVAINDDESEESRKQIYDYIQILESKSFQVCEQCGDVGQPIAKGWIKTLCNACAFCSEPDTK